VLSYIFLFFILQLIQHINYFGLCVSVLLFWSYSGPCFQWRILGIAAAGFLQAKCPLLFSHQFKTMKQNCDCTESSNKTQMYCWKALFHVDRAGDNHLVFKCVNIVIPLCRVYLDDGYLLYVTVLFIFVAFDVRIVWNYTVSQKEETLNSCPYLCKILTDFRNSYLLNASVKEFRKSVNI